MNILIAYASKSGTTAKCAALLAAELEGHKVTLADLRESKPDPAEFDFTAVGSPIRMGKLLPAAANYIDETAGRLKALRCGFFICCGYIDSAGEYVRRLIPAELRGAAEEIACFGGELTVKNHKGVERFIVRAMRGDILDDGSRDGEANHLCLPSIMTDSIRRFADVIRRARG